MFCPFIMCHEIFWHKSMTKEATSATAAVFSILSQNSPHFFLYNNDQYVNIWYLGGNSDWKIFPKMKINRVRKFELKYIWTQTFELKTAFFFKFDLIWIWGFPIFEIWEIFVFDSFQVKIYLKFILKIWIWFEFDLNQKVSSNFCQTSKLHRAQLVSQLDI